MTLNICVSLETFVFIYEDENDFFKPSHPSVYFFPSNVVCALTCLLPLFPSVQRAYAAIPSFLVRFSVGDNNPVSKFFFRCVLGEKTLCILWPIVFPIQAQCSGPASVCVLQVKILYFEAKADVMGLGKNQLNNFKYKWTNKSQLPPSIIAAWQLFL